MAGYSQRHLFRLKKKRIAEFYDDPLLVNDSLLPVLDEDETLHQNVDYHHAADTGLQQNVEVNDVIPETHHVEMRDGSEAVTEIDSNDESDSSICRPESTDDEIDDVPHAPMLENTPDFLPTDEARFEDSLASWAVNCGITQAATSKLLNLLKVHECHKTLPSDARTLLKTPRSTNVLDVPPGDYCRIGLAKGIIDLFSSVPVYKIPDVLQIKINIDGIPLTKSANSQFWPILGACQKPFSEPFVIGVYHGYSKPDSVAEYLRYFVDEAKEILQNGLVLKGVLKTVVISAFVCDAPARAFVKSIKGHSGYYACGKCSVRGEYVGGKVVFVDTNAPLRTDADFAARMPEEDHHVGNSPLEELGIEMVSQFPVEYMHLCTLGVMRKITKIFLKGKLPLRWSSRMVAACSADLVALAPYVASEFSRKLRSLKYADRWKATEWRQLLLYTGVVVLKNQLPAYMYEHFLSFHCAITILCSKHVHHLFGYADQLLKYFVEMFEEVYGRENMTYNVHGLCHLAGDAQKFGSLDEFSAFPFENHLQKLKNTIRTTSGKPLQQLCNRLAEKTHCIPQTESLVGLGHFPRHNGPDGRLIYEEFRLTNKQGDNCCVLLHEIIVVIHHFPTEYVYGQYFIVKEDFYINPGNSSLLGIYQVSRLSPLSRWPIHLIKRKALRFLLKNGEFLILPLCHST